MSGANHVQVTRGGPAPGDPQYPPMRIRGASLMEPTGVKPGICALPVEPDPRPGDPSAQCGQKTTTGEARAQEQGGAGAVGGASRREADRARAARRPISAPPPRLHHIVCEDAGASRSHRCALTHFQILGEAQRRITRETERRAPSAPYAEAVGNAEGKGSAAGCDSCHARAPDRANTAPLEQARQPVCRFIFINKCLSGETSRYLLPPRN